MHSLRGGVESSGLVIIYKEDSYDEKKTTDCFYKLYLYSISDDFHCNRLFNEHCGGSG